jgi:Lrp/AsnC family transcriptional regulator, regulator for asnA, asnC and gidA
VRNVARQVDGLDRQLIALLTEDGRLSLADAAQRAGVSRPTVAARLRALLADGVLRVAALVDPFEVKNLTVALVGVTLDKFLLDETIEQIAALEEVDWAAVVTGRYDIIVEVATEDGMAGLYRFLTQSLAAIGSIKSSEMFVVMKASRKWSLLSPGMREEWGGSGGNGPAR